MKEIHFPVYRKLSNGLNLYEILSHDEFIEIQFIGNKKRIEKFKAFRYPEKLKIKDMLNLNGYELITKKEFKSHL